MREKGREKREKDRKWTLPDIPLFIAPHKLLSQKSEQRRSHGCRHALLLASSLMCLTIFKFLQFRATCEQLKGQHDVNCYYMYLNSKALRYTTIKVIKIHPLLFQLTPSKATQIYRQIYSFVYLYIIGNYCIVPRIFLKDIFIKSSSLILKCGHQNVKYFYKY